MRCPVCSEVMVTLELNQVEIDYCSVCGGVWLDAGELELLLDGGDGVKDLLASFSHDQTSKEKKRRCPICRKKMSKVSGGLGERILIDKCPFGDGLWFDAGELAQLIAMGSPDKSNPVIGLLEEIFGSRS